MRGKGNWVSECRERFRADGTEVEGRWVASRAGSAELLLCSCPHQSTAASTQGMHMLPVATNL